PSPVCAICASLAAGRRGPHPSPTRRSSDLRGRHGGPEPRGSGPAAKDAGVLEQDRRPSCKPALLSFGRGTVQRQTRLQPPHPQRSEEHTSELQSRENLVCRLLLEKKNMSAR